MTTSAARNKELRQLAREFLQESEPQTINIPEGGQQFPNAKNPVSWPRQFFEALRLANLKLIQACHYSNPGKFMVCCPEKGLFYIVRTELALGRAKEGMTLEQGTYKWYVYNLFKLESSQIDSLLRKMAKEMAMHGICANTGVIR